MQSKQKTLLIILAVVLGCFLVALVPLAVLAVFAVSVYGTHQEWKEEVAEPTASAVAHRLESSRSRSADNPLTGNDVDADAGAAVRIRELQRQLDAEKAARRQAVADVEARAVQLKGRLAELEKRNRELTESQRVAIEAAKEAEANLRRFKEEIPSRREQMADRESDGDEHAKSATALADQLHNASSVRQLVEGREAPSAGELPEVRKKEEAPEDPPAELSCEIKAVSKSGLVEVSVGFDDGLRDGHKLDVYRDDGLLTRLVILKTTPDRAVARVNDTQPVQIQKGDRVVLKSGE